MELTNHWVTLEKCTRHETHDSSPTKQTTTEAVAKLTRPKLWTQAVVKHWKNARWHENQDSSTQNHTQPKPWNLQITATVLAQLLGYQADTPNSSRELAA